MKGSYFFWESPNNRLTCKQGQKTHSLSYYMHLFLPYVLNDSQTINFSKPLLCAMLICCDWSHFNFITPVTPDKAAFVSAVLLVYSITRETSIVTALKAAPSGQEWICIFTKRSTSGRQYASVLCWCQHETAWDSFKNDSFQWFRVDSFFWDTTAL